VGDVRDCDAAVTAGSLSTRGAPGAVYLTFDDGPHPVHTRAVLRELAACEATATFFVTPGPHAWVLDEIRAGGHAVAYHCGRHVRHSDRSRSEVRHELLDDLAELESGGMRPTAWRPPWGELAAWTPALAAASQLDLWGWSDDTEDWAGHDTETMLSRLSSGLGPGAVVLMHDGVGPGARRGGCESTVALVEPLCRLARDRGLEPMPLSRQAAARSVAGEGT
jgi:peptidoglycan/xylan/chitin deacetylase (PgdA/CDA1 family)